jgi:hypothetical protein
MVAKILPKWRGNSFFGKRNENLEDRTTVFDDSLGEFSRNNIHSLNKGQCYS